MVARIKSEKFTLKTAIRLLNEIRLSEQMDKRTKNLMDNQVDISADNQTDNMANNQADNQMLGIKDASE